LYVVDLCLRFEGRFLVYVLVAGAGGFGDRKQERRRVKSQTES